ncbi:hypothetical protein UFOVP402_10 [uncultured Caudovirales phage]|uniref:Uncharacterized protein n=1 Tax=uncultured Caudovirales phage TaxID=2100421 RepID=A0A6J5M4Z2_9CAUD|nr:hypothetical protein UFOVP402_10 [uncultured Caudovirales phage]
MVKRITHERWVEAQKAERQFHTMSREEGQEHYRKTYEKYFQYLEIDHTRGFTDKIIIEIGCADFPALQWVNCCHGFLVEPMPSEILKHIAFEKDYEIIAEPFEEIAVPTCDEIWLLNVMQHVIDPDLFIEKCKAASDVIRFFEPIDWPIEIYHPHTFTFEYYKGHFPDAKLYPGTDPGFHTAKCAYGVWSRV